MNIDERLELLAKIQESHESAIKELFDLHTRAAEKIDGLTVKVEAGPS